MEPQELRIGSTYMSVKFNQPVTLTAEDVYELVVRADGADISHYIHEMFIPIPLTEEELIDLGFEKRSDYFGGYTVGKPGEYFRLMEKVIKKNNEPDYTAFIFTSGKQLEIKYVHQLQILYSSLKGKELTRKPKNAQKKAVDHEK